MIESINLKWVGESMNELRVDITTQHKEATAFYRGYLLEAVSIFKYAISHLSAGCADMGELGKAWSMAHNIKGNAFLYGYPKLGEQARRVETVLKGTNDADNLANATRDLISLIDLIFEICSAMDKEEALTPQTDLTAQTLPDEVSSPTLQVDLGRKTVLLVYNDPWIADLLASLMHHEFNIMMCSSIEDAIGICDKRLPDLIVTEKSLQDYQAFKLITYVSSITDLSDLPIFLLSNDKNQADIAKALGLGVREYFEDPYEILPIANRVRGVLSEKPSQIFIVDDDSAVRRILQQRFETDGFTVNVAGDGFEAIEYLKDNRPDLIVLDRFLPRIEGTSVLYEIQNNINLKPIPVMILTAMSNRTEGSLWLKRGAVDFIPKPFNPEEVLLRAKKILNMKGRKVV